MDSGQVSLVNESCYVTHVYLRDYTPLFSVQEIYYEIFVQLKVQDEGGEGERSLRMMNTLLEKSWTNPMNDHRQAS